MKDYIIFDMDGVLIDSETWYQNILMKFLQENHIQISKQRLNASTGLSTEGFYLHNCDKIHLTKKDFIDQYHTYINQYGEPDYKQILYPHVKECFEKLYQKGIEIIIASSSPRQIIQNVLETTQLKEYVKFYLGSEDVHIRKPDPEIYLKIIQMQGYLPLFVVEDSYYGIQAAKSAHTKVIAYAQKEINQSNSDMIINNHLEILDYC